MSPASRQIKLVEYQCFLGGRFKESEVRKASDLFAALEHGRRDLPKWGQLKRAVFSVLLNDASKPRRVTIRPPNIAIYDRDTDSDVVEAWLRRQGFIVKKADEKSAAVEQAVVGARGDARSGGGPAGVAASP
jgi:hypothetical protein